MLTKNDREREDDATKDETAGRFQLAASKWETISQIYSERGRGAFGDSHDICEGARASLRAAADYRQAAARAAAADKPAFEAKAKACYENAAALYELCGERCIERGDWPGASEGFAGAETCYERLEKDARAKNDAAGAAAAHANLEKVHQHQREVERAEKESDKGLLKMVSSMPFEVGESRLAISPRLWLGIQPHYSERRGVWVASIVPESPAEVAGLRRGDSLVKLNGEALADVDGISDVLQQAAPGDILQWEVRRGTRTLSCSMAPELVLYGNRDIVCKTVDGKKCDADCHCTRAHQGSACSLVYVYEREGPHGGIVYRKRCAAMTKDYEILCVFECDRGEYI